jgi:hypothetical protein
MLLFVFITLLALAWSVMPRIWWHYYSRQLPLKIRVLSVLYALLGTFFFHNMW